MTFSDFAFSPARGDLTFGERLLRRLNLDGPLLLAVAVLALMGLAILYGAKIGRASCRARV